MAESKELTATVEHVPRPGAAAQLTVLEGCARGARFKVSESATLGRSPDATIMLEDAEISRLHARISRTDIGTFVLEDLGSRNGTFVNGARIKRRVLAYGDKIRLGPQTVLELNGFDPVEDYIIQRQRFESLGRLSVGVSHDLNNVLATLDAGASYLQQLPDGKRLKDGDVQDCLSDVTLAVGRARELTRSIVSFARGWGTDRTAVDVSTLVAEVVRMLRLTFERNIRIEQDTTPLAFVYGSRSELHQVILNLCLNARDAMPNGGVLQLATAKDSTPPRELEWNEGQKAVVICVKDSGFGMDTEVQSRVFELFFTTKREGVGFGLGLANVREIVSLHGGQIFLKTAPGQGACFTIYLPLLQVDSVRMSTTQGESLTRVTVPPAQSSSVLLVDDEALVRRSVARRLRQAGIEVAEAVDGIDALEQYAKKRFGLVVLDFDMPRLDGPATQGRLLEMDPEVSIVFATGYVDSERLTSVRTRGALAVLEKPYNFDTLIGLANEAAIKNEK